MELQKTIKGTFNIRYDGSWSTKRNATHCLVEFIDDSQKIVDFDIISRADTKTIEKAKKDGIFKNKNILTWVTDDGKFLGPSNMMEDFLVAGLVTKWKSNQNLRCYIHDGDCKTLKYWEKDDNDFSEILEMHSLQILICE